MGDKESCVIDNRIRRTDEGGETRGLIALQLAGKSVRPLRALSKLPNGLLRNTFQNAIAINGRKGGRGNAVPILTIDLEHIAQQLVPFFKGGSQSALESTNDEVKQRRYNWMRKFWNTVLLKIYGVSKESMRTTDNEMKAIENKIDTERENVRAICVGIVDNQRQLANELVTRAGTLTRAAVGNNDRSNNTSVYLNDLDVRRTAMQECQEI